MLLVEEILLCLNVLNGPVVFVEECKCTCAPSLKFLHWTFNSEWPVTDSKAFSRTGPNKPRYRDVYGLVVECKRHKCFVLTFVSPELGVSPFFFILFFNLRIVIETGVFYVALPRMVKSCITPDVCWNVHKCHSITVKPKVNFESLLLQIDRNQVIALDDYFWEPLKYVCFLNSGRFCFCCLHCNVIQV